MFGPLLVCFQNYMLSAIGQEGWESLLQKAGFPNDKTYHTLRFYPDEEFEQLLDLATIKIGISKDKLLRRLGKDFASYIANNFANMFLSSWTMLDIIEKAAPSLYNAMQMIDPNAPKSYVRTKRESPDEIALYYMSPRKMCGYVIGIIEGLADCRNEIIKISHSACMQRGATECEIHIKLVKEREPDTTASGANIANP